MTSNRLLNFVLLFAVLVALTDAKRDPRRSHNRNVEPSPAGTTPGNRPSSPAYTPTYPTYPTYPPRGPPPPPTAPTPNPTPNPTTPNPTTPTTPPPQTPTPPPQTPTPPPQTPTPPPQTPTPPQPPNPTPNPGNPQQNCNGRGRICQAGTCRGNGNDNQQQQCVPHDLTQDDVRNITAIIDAMFEKCAQSEVTSGDCHAGYIRAAFHDVTGTRKPMCCLLVPCTPPMICDRNREENKGLEESVALTLKTYWDNDLSHQISICDFFHLCATNAVRRASGGDINVPFVWGRESCPGLDMMPEQNTRFPLSDRGNYPSVIDSFEAISNIFERNLGLQRAHWMCLIGAHSVGRMEKINTGYVRSWTKTPFKLSNQYYMELDNFTTQWAVEEMSDTDSLAPGLLHVQYQVVGTPKHTGLAMNKADMTFFWNVDNPNCVVHHPQAAQACPLRRSGQSINGAMGEHAFMQFLARNPAAWRRCFSDAYFRLVTLNTDGLRAPL